MDCRSDSHRRGIVHGDGACDCRHPKVVQPDNALEVIAIGHQFWWEYRYPWLGVVTANELHVPVSDPGTSDANVSHTAFR